MFSIQQVAEKVVGTGTAAGCTDAALNAALDGAGLVTFNCGGPATIDISTTKTIATDTIIDGSGMITINGGNSVGVFRVSPGVNFTVKNLTIANGLAHPGGGGIYNDGGVLTVTNSTFTGNRGHAGIGDSGSRGAIYDNDGVLTVTNSTFTGNRAVFGGAIFNGGLRLRATISNSILGRSTSHGSPSSNCGDIAFTDGGHNLDDGTSCGFSAANGSLSNTDPELDPSGLQDNGGPTQTVALCTAAGAPAGCTAASPAIDAGDPDICAAAPVGNRDQRGFVRPGTGHTNCSIGAYEASGVAPEACVGDCDAGGSVSINEIITLVNIALGNAQPSVCPHGVSSGAAVDIALIIQAVNAALGGCSG